MRRPAAARPPPPRRPCPWARLADPLRTPRPLLAAPLCSRPAARLLRLGRGSRARVLRGSGGCGRAGRGRAPCPKWTTSVRKFLGDPKVCSGVAEGSRWGLPAAPATPSTDLHLIAEEAQAERVVWAPLTGLSPRGAGLGRRVWGVPGTEALGEVAPSAALRHSWPGALILGAPW